MESEIELLSPAGDFECLKAAVQNGANCIYFGANLFSARAYANNFDDDELAKAIEYCKIRGVKTNLTLNILIKDDELESAFNVAKKAYESGIDAIIVQDLGLAKMLIKNFPDLPIHASTQMSVHNLQGVLELQELGFSRVVLSRELSIEEIEYICENSNIEIECFIHGALCISYSGQCLFSSMIGGRSGNRGKCAQSCRLPYELIENEKTTLDKGYLLSPRDLCSLDYLPRLINCGVKSLKVEGRMKSPEYVATVTRIYRKYINLAKSNKTYKIDEQDRKDLMQVFNRGNFSSGHLNPHANKNLIFSEKPNNMGLFLGHVAKYNPSKGLITLNLNEPIEIGDTIALEKETGTYTISELMTKNTNIKTANPNDFVTIGRMKGNIKVGDKIYKMSSKQLTTLAYSSFENDIQTKKIPLNCEIKIVKNSPISIHVSSACYLEIYRKLDIYCEIDAIPTDSIKHPLEKEKVILLKPQTYMNLSGNSVKEVVDFYKIEKEKILVIYDDMDIEPGKIKIRKKGSAGGHNGMKSIIQMIGTEEFPRIRVGIGRPIRKDDEINYVIGAIPEEDLKRLDEGIEKAQKAVEEILRNGVDSAMNKYN